MHRNTTNSSIPIGSNVQFSTKHRKRTSNNNTNFQQWTNRIAVCIDTFSSNIVGTLYHLKGSLFQINLKTAIDKKKLIAIIN